jgi:RecB family exonuclease
MARKLPTLTEYRQSTLRAHATCPRRTRFELQAGDVTTGWSEAYADLGTVGHAVLAEIMETLRRQGEKQMATEEAMVICWEVYNAHPVILPAKELEDLAWMIRGFCQYEWRPERTLSIEEPLRVEIVCPDGVTRTVKGQPDLVIADPPYGVIVVDYKFGMARPKAPRQAPAEGEAVVGKQYLSDAGLFQREVYGLLVLHRYPHTRYAMLRELPLRFPHEGPREADLQRSDLEHVEKAVGSRMMKLAHAIDEGPKSPLWSPRPGSHCNKCPVARSCPVPREMRGTGAIATPAQADAAASALARLSAKREQLTGQVKSFHESTGHAAVVNEHEEMRWGPDRDAWMAKGGGRKFGLWPRVESEDAA